MKFSTLRIAINISSTGQIFKHSFMEKRAEDFAQEHLFLLSLLCLLAFSGMSCIVRKVILETVKLDNISLFPTEHGTQLI